MRRKVSVPIVLAGGLFCLAVVISIVMVVLMMMPSETYVSEDLLGEQYYVLDCKAYYPRDSFFVPTQDYADAVHRIKFTYDNGSINNSSYTYNVAFGSKDIAKTQASRMQWDYNEYMSKTGIYQEDLTPVFNYYNNDVRVGLFFKKEHLVSDISELLFLSKDEFNRIRDYSIDDLSKIYEDKNFSCQINDFNN